MSSDRREFLKFLMGSTAVGAAISPIELIIQTAIFESRRAQAATVAGNKFYVNLQLYAAPEHVTYDLFLDPYGNGMNIVPNGGVHTNYKLINGRYSEGEYKTVKLNINGEVINAPWMWGQKMATSKGFKPIHELMKNMLVIQGVDTTSPGHSLSATKSEEANNLTVAGLLSDKIKSPFKALDMDSLYTFKSKTGNSITNVSSNISRNVYEELLSKFDNKLFTQTNKLNNNIHASLKNAIDNLNYDASKRTPNSLNLKKTYDGAMNIIESSISELASTWDTKLNKYKNIIEQSTLDRTNFKGICDMPIGAIDNRDTKYRFNQNNVLCLTADMRDILHKDTFTSMASHFAVAELIADKKFATSINSRITNPNVRMITSTNPKVTNYGITHDQHFLGTMMSTLTNSVMYRCISSCIYDLKEYLENESNGYKFNDTVIRLNGEFNRSIRNDGSGSDHGWQAHSTTLFSGMVEKPMILGRIYKDAAAKGLTNSAYKGSWGFGAELKINGVDQVISQGNVISSISSILGIPSPAFNSPSLIKLRNEKVELIDPEYKLKVVA